MGNIANKPLKIVPLAISGFLTWRIYNCPCDKLMACTFNSSMLLIGLLAAMTIFGFPI